MIRSFQTSLEPITRNRQNFLNLSSNRIRAGFLAVFLISQAGCSGPRLHSDLKADPQILTRKWTLSTHGTFEAGDHGTEFSNALMVENTLVFGSRNAGLVSLYPGMNLRRWTLKIPGGVVSEIALDRDTLYFGGGDGFIYAVNSENGRINWRYEVRNPIVSRPTVKGGRLFVTSSDDTVYALDSGTGKWLWHYKRRSASVATVHGASSPLVDGNEVIVGLSDGFLVALSLEEGSLVWERKLHSGIRFVDVNAHPLLENGILYIPSYDGALYALKRHGGEVIWRFDAGGSRDVVMDRDRLILPSSDGTIYALNKESARVEWKFELDRGAPTQAILTDRYVIVASSFQYLYVLDKNTGKGLYRFDVGYGSGFYGSPLFDSKTQRLYILSNAGNLYAFALKEPSESTPQRSRLKGGAPSPSL